MDSVTLLAALALDIAERHRQYMTKEPFDVQAARVLQRLERIHRRTPLMIPVDVGLDMAGFGTAPVRASTDEDSLVLVSDAAEALGMTASEGCQWARREYLDGLEAQRLTDEERDDGFLGWDELDEFHDLGLILRAYTDGPLSGPAGSFLSRHTDYLVVASRLPGLIMISPWASEYFASVHGSRGTKGESDPIQVRRGPIVPTEDD